MLREKGERREEHDGSSLMSPPPPPPPPPATVLLQALLVRECCCDSADEAAAIAEAVMMGDGDGDPAARLAEFFAPEVVRSVLARLLAEETNDNDNDNDNNNNNNNSKRVVSSSSAEAEDDCSSEEDDEEDGPSSLINNHDDDDDDDELFLQPGDCQLCERSQVKLTRHHLIPRSTWSRLEVQLLRCVTNQHTIDRNSVAFSTGWEGLEHVRTSFVEAVEANNNNRSAQKKKKASSTAKSSSSSGSGSTPRAVLRALLNRQTVDLCRPCHSAVHDAHDNRTLARHYNTLDGLLTCDAVYNFAKWNSTQKAAAVRTGRGFNNNNRNNATTRRRRKAKT